MPGRFARILRGVGYRRWVRGFVGAIALAGVGDFAFGVRSGGSIDGKTVVVEGMVGPLVLSVRGSGGRVERVRLLGVASPGDATTHARMCSAMLPEEVRHIVGQTVHVRTDGPRRRDGDGAIGAFVWTADGRMFNEMLVREGWALADRREANEWSGAFDADERAARGRKAGLWSVMTWSDMPDWRRGWEQGQFSRN